MLSLRNALKSQDISACPKGLLGLNPFYLKSAAAKKSFGFQRVSQIITALRWPNGFVAMADYPHDDSQSWQDNPEGLAHDDATWFWTSPGALMTIPISTGLQGLSTDHFDNRHSNVPLGNGATYSLASTEPGGADTDIIQIDPMANYYHLGGLTIQRLGEKSILYIPVQQGTMPGDDTSGNTYAPIIYALESISGKSIIDHNWSAFISQPGDQGAWCAYDPVAHRLYSSAFYGAPTTADPTTANLFGGSSVDVYSVGTPAEPDLGFPVAGQPLELTPIGSMTLFEADGETPAILVNIQAGFITASRHLYLVQDDGTGLVAFDLITGRKQLTIPVDYQHIQGIANATYQEIEGACLFSNPPAPGMSGDIHVMLYENGGGPIGRDFWMKHYQVNDPKDRPFI